MLRWRARELEVEDVLTALDPPRRFGAHGGWKAADFELDLRLEPDGEGNPGHDGLVKALVESRDG